MNTQDMISICSDYDTVIKPNFRGVYACDAFISEWRKNLITPLNLFIVNTRNIQDPGLHWILYGIGVDKTWFFDSFCQHPRVYGLDVVPPLDTVILAPFRVQSDISYLCGLYCIYVAHQLSLGKSLSTALHPFSFENLIQNDSDLINWFRNTSYRWLFQAHCSTLGDPHCISYTELKNGNTGRLQGLFSQTSKFGGNPR